MVYNERDGETEPYSVAGDVLAAVASLFVDSISAVLGL